MAVPLLQEHRVGIPSEAVEFMAAPGTVGRQQMSNWCWAACVQVILNMHGVHADQQAIVGRIFGALVDAPAGPPQILTALNGWGIDVQGRPATVAAEPLRDPGSLLIELANQRPVLVGLRGRSPAQQGHAYVLTGAAFCPTPDGLVLTRVVLRDPWPSSPSRIEMPASEFQARYMFGARVSVQHL